VPGVTVLIADDHTLFAEALEAILSMDGRITIVGRAANGAEAVELAHARRPDVVLMDVSMPVLDGIEATRQIAGRVNGTRVLVLSGSAAVADVDRARGAGAAAYVTKDLIADELVRAILDVAGR
jgi:DNA-binding NarL/FixJ family response regulator